jgi:3-hydroxyacyl-[acyl-carrier-protein] dehydratase
MLIGNLFNISQITYVIEGEFNISFNCNSEHKIFDGHFPGEPILPGVCMVQFVRECLEKVLNKKLQLNSSKTVKFINIINPINEKLLVLEIKTTYTEDGLVEARAVIKNNESKVFFQMRGVWDLLL